MPQKRLDMFNQLHSIIKLKFYNNTLMATFHINYHWACTHDRIKAMEKEWM